VQRFYQVEWVAGPRGKELKWTRQDEKKQANEELLGSTKGGKTYRMRKAGEPEELQKSIYEKLDVKWDRLPETNLEVKTEAIL